MYLLIAAVYTLLPAIAAESLANSICIPNPSAPTLPKPIPIFDVPSTFAKAAKYQDADTVAQILNTLSLYPLSIDGKDFKSLSLVFTEDAVANFSAPVGVLTPLTAIQSGIGKTLASVDTQHTYGTQIVEVLDGCSARSVSYFTISHFGRGSYAGQVVYAYGQYQDTFIRNRGDQWKIQTRNLVYMGPLIGNLSIFSPST